jgi:hypothetical protein
MDTGDRNPMKVLVAIQSCAAHRDRHEAQRNTWLADLPLDYRFFIGQSSIAAEDEEVLNCPDDYQSLAIKTKAMIRWALDRSYDYLFKCDTDTVVNPWGLICSGFRYYDYIGGYNADIVPFFTDKKIEFASGGAGYWLSRKAMAVLDFLDAPRVAAEDVFVANTLSTGGIFPEFHSGYRWRPGEDVDENVITLHLSSALQKKYEPSMMYEYYDKIKRVAKP